MTTTRWSDEEEEQQAKRGFLARVSANQRTSRMQARMSRMSGRGGGPAELDRRRRQEAREAVFGQEDERHKAMSKVEENDG